MRNSLMNVHLKKAGLITLMVAMPLAACTDLTEVPSSAISPENFYANEAEVIGGLASVYAQLRTTTDEYYNVSEVSSDEIIQLPLFLATDTLTLTRIAGTTPPNRPTSPAGSRRPRRADRPGS